MKVRLPYGDSFLEVNLPDRNTTLLTGKNAPRLKDESKAILSALRTPIGCTALRECIKKNDKIAVITTDNTRACPDDRILPVILEELEAIVPRENIAIIVALGLHAPLTHDELERKLGKDIAASHMVLNHNPALTTCIGETRRGTPIEVYTPVLAADFRISIGLIEPHFFAGFSGGRKSISPGVSSARSIRANHSFRMIEHPSARAGVLAGNPVHEDMLEQAAKAGLDFIVNVILNEDGGITNVYAGEMKAAHEAGCRQALENSLVRLDRPADITLTTNSGAPLDLNFYQTVKGIDAAARITRPGGIIIVAAACPKGLGPEAFHALHAEASSPNEVLKTISCSEEAGVCWQNQVLARAQVEHDVFLVSELDDEAVNSMMVTPVASVKAALEKAFLALGKNASLVVIPGGPKQIPVLEEDTWSSRNL
jgi:nickel-dependent lactate racemase